VADALAIETVDLRKTYAGTEALRGLSLGVPAGSICGFLGRNGAGKTTTIKILLGMARPTAGAARVLGLDATVDESSVAIRRRTAFVSEDKDLYGHLTVAEIVRFTAAFYPRWRGDLQDQYLRRFDLPAGRRVKALSRGMRTKLALLLALCRGAELLILDEPTAGLDPAAAEDVLQALVSHVARGETTVFFSSHQIAEVDQIADRIAIVERGRVAVCGPIDDVRGQYQRVQLVFDGEPPAVTWRAPGIVRVARNGRVITVIASDGGGAVVDAARALAPRAVEATPLTLKEIFLEVSAEEH
jgi:ABC-2 type transport system ATP-binding protein